MSKRTPLAAESTWSNKKTLLAQLQKLWERGVILQQVMEDRQLFPKRLSFKTPSSQALSEQFDAVRSWVAEIQKLSGFRVVYKTLRHRVIGENSLPAEIWIDDLETAVTLLNKQTQCAAFSQLLADTRQRAPQLIVWIQQTPLKALSLAGVWPKLLDFVIWRQQHADPGIFLRQISLPAIDSKLIEQYRSTLAPLLDLSLDETQINRNSSGIRHFARRYGFREKPAGIRFRLLDPALRLLPGDDQDITLSAADFQALYRQPGLSQRLKRVFITENEINFLAFPAQPDSLVIFGAGYGFDALARADWISTLEIFYWGDIDSHGFAILDQLREKFPSVQSMLMDRQTLLDHRPFWGQEASPEHKALPRLSSDEQALYQALLSHHYQPNLRLEQERVQYDYVLATLSNLVSVR